MAVGEAFCSVPAVLIGKDIHRCTKVVLKRLQQAVSLEAGATAVLGVICTHTPAPEISYSGNIIIRGGAPAGPPQGIIFPFHVSL